VLDKLSCDAVKPDQLAQLHDIGLSQPLRPAQGPGGAEVEWWKLGNMVLGVLVASMRRRALSQFVLLRWKHGFFDVFGRMTTSEHRTH